MSFFFCFFITFFSSLFLPCGFLALPWIEVFSFLLFCKVALNYSRLVYSLQYEYFFFSLLMWCFYGSLHSVVAAYHTLYTGRTLRCSNGNPVGPPRGCPVAMRYPALETFVLYCCCAVRHCESWLRLLVSYVRYRVVCSVRPM